MGRRICGRGRWSIVLVALVGREVVVGGVLEVGRWWGSRREERMVR